MKEAYDLIDITLKNIRDKDFDDSIVFLLDLKDSVLAVDIMEQECLIAHNAPEEKWWFNRLYRITPKGLSILESGIGYKAWKEAKDSKEAERLDLETQKIKIDLENAKNVLSTYKTTRFIAWFGVALSLTAISIQLWTVLHTAPELKVPPVVKYQPKKTP